MIATTVDFMAHVACGGKLSVMANITGSVISDHFIVHVEAFRN